MNYLEWVPPEIGAKIFSHLPPKEYRKIGKVSKRLRQQYHHEYVRAKRDREDFINQNMG